MRTIEQILHENEQLKDDILCYKRDIRECIMRENIAKMAIETQRKEIYRLVKELNEYKDGSKETK